MCHTSLANDWHWDCQPGMPFDITAYARLASRSIIECVGVKGFNLRACDLCKREGNGGEWPDYKFNGINED
ncbi:hypothetical protein Tco_1425368 [Tanacetum coccineum]